MLVNIAWVARLYKRYPFTINVYVSLGLIPSPVEINNILHWDMGDIVKSLIAVKEHQDKCSKHKRELKYASNG